MSDRPALSLSRRHPLLRRFLLREDGSGTALAVFFMAICVGLAGFAIDLERASTLQVQLQAVADSAAHAAMIARSTQVEADAKTTAVNIATRNMPSATFGTVLSAADIQFGTWNSVSRTFTPVAGSTEAVQVTLRRTAANSNPVRTFLMRFRGTKQLDLTRRSIMLGYDPDCLREGFVAQGMVDIQSNNTFKNGFCIHSNSVVKVSSGNYFETGVKVSMPDKTLVQMPNSGFSSSPGLEAALSSNRYDIRILSRITTIIDGLNAGNTLYVPSYITNRTPISVNPSSVKKNSFQQGRMYTVTCTGNQKMTIGSDFVVTKTVVTTNCPITFSNGAKVEDAVIATTNTDVKSIDGPNGIVLGKNDNCGTGGGAQILTMGGMSFASGLEVYGAQLLAVKDIAFSASALGVKGAAFVSGGTISTTSGVTMSYCSGAGMEQNFRMIYAKLVL
ncbi:TadG family pilus assembly protein [Paragemmobacter straminiformis]|uniref:Flp pilus-assembly TadG-like N-terminal domain-containing protein n=1 Tax=Paragemmobacter straminiformis TaxID=2045119 RepID=A0A842I3H2_9RHOB|nr:TadG family pilus assembly protein [Gemmobacter straminiformis]MBC2833997.1 hypothetical protein [Gemmobacter straminiformis]